MTTTFEPAVSSAVSRMRPSRARAPSIAKVFDDTSVPVKRAEPAAVGISVIGGVIVNAMSDNVVVLFRHVVNSAHDMPVLRRSGALGFGAAARSTIRTSRSESLYGSGSRSTVLTTLKTAVAAPMPRASVSTAAVVKPGLRLSPRRAYATSPRTVTERAAQHVMCITYMLVLYHQCERRRCGLDTLVSLMPTGMFLRVPTT